MKSNKKAITAICCIGVACVAILITCMLLGVQTKTNFETDAPTASPTSSWVEDNTASQPETIKVTPAPALSTEDVLKDYPKVVEETPTEVFIDFTPPEGTVSPTPEPAIEREEEAAATPTPPPVQEDPPQVGGGGGVTDGPGNDDVIDDPVFGKVYAGEAQQQQVDNDGDPEKQIGIM